MAVHLFVVVDRSNWKQFKNGEEDKTQNMALFWKLVSENDKFV